MTVSRLALGCAVSIFATTLFAASGAMAVPTSVSVGGTSYTVQGLVGVGHLPASLRDQYGETFGSISGLSADISQWSLNGSTYTGRFTALPDRGFNVTGTTDYAPRLNTIDFTFSPAPLGSTNNNQAQLVLSLNSSQRLYEQTANGPQFFTGLDPVPGGVATGGARAATATLPQLPQAYNGKLSLDPEAVVRLPDGGTLISDEYGPSIYRFDVNGQFVGALPVPAKFIPIRNGVADFSANSPAAGQPAPSQANPTSGRQNNQGFEGMSLAPDGRTLIVVLQSALVQDLNINSTNTTRRNTRVLTYDISDINNPVVSGEYALQLPTYPNANNNTRIAAQSEIVALSATRFLILPRDGAGHGNSDPLSRYRDVDIVDLTGATDIRNRNQIAPNGVLDPAITPATLTRWLNINDATELSRFGLRNGLPDDDNNLSEKWEGLALLPALDASAPFDYYLFVANDNDFLTFDGFQAGAAYNAGVNNNTTFLVYRVTLPGFVQPAPEPAAITLLGVGLAGVAAFARRRKA